MPICSYIIYPDAGKAETLRLELQRLTGCTVFPAEAHELLLLVTETANDVEEKQLQQEIKALPGIHCMAMSFAHGEQVREAANGEDAVLVPALKTS